MPTLKFNSSYGPDLRAKSPLIKGKVKNHARGVVSVAGLSFSFTISSNSDAFRCM